MSVSAMKAMQGVHADTGPTTAARSDRSAPAAQAPALPPDAAGGLVFSRWPLALVVLFGVVLIGLVWIAVVSKAMQEEQSEIVAIERRTMNLARAFQEHTTRTLGGADQALRFVKYQYERQGEALDIAAAVEQGMIVSDLFNQIGVIDANGIYTLSSLPGFKRVDLSDREHFRVHKDDPGLGLFVSKPVLGRATGKWSVQITRRIDGPGGSFGGVSVISIDPFYFTTLYSEVDLGRDGVIKLVGLDGIVRARLAGEVSEVGQDVGGTDIFKAVQANRAGHYFAASPIDGIARVYSYRQLDDLPLAVVVGMGLDDALAEFHARRSGYFSFAGGITLVIVLFCTLLFGLLVRQRRIAMRLHEMKSRAESANQLKSDFLASMSHELRTPLNGVIGYAELLVELADDDERRQYAQVIRDSGDHLLTLLNSILDMARLEAGKMPIVAGPVRVDELVSQACAIHRPVAEAKGLVLDCQAPGALTAHADRTRVLQVLNNLLHNALKFTDAGRVALRVRVEGERCVFEVSDTGCGIDPAQHAAIFERFRQADDFETRSQGGAGLGLALCRELIELMGGRIWLDSAPGQGAAFSFSLPLEREGASR